MPFAPHRQNEMATVTMFLPLRNPPTDKAVRQGQALFNFRKWREWPVRFLLIPVGGRAVVVAAVVGTAVLNGYSDGFLKGNGIENVVAVDRPFSFPVGVLFVKQRSAGEKVLGILHTPGVAEIILGAGAV